MYRWKGGALHSEEPVCKKDPIMAALITVEAHLSSRLLYANPVCLLCTVPPPPSASASSSSSSSPSSSLPANNVMTISWLTSVDNRGTFVMSMNTRRKSAALLLGEGVRRHYVVSCRVACIHVCVFSVCLVCV